MDRHVTHMQFEAGATCLVTPSGDPLVLSVSPAALVAAALRHDPPTPGELELGIELTEDAIMALPMQRFGGATLMLSDPVFAPWVPPQEAQVRWTREQVEVRFRALAAVSQGDVRSMHEWPGGRELAAALLILRECMHHLDFDAVICSRLPLPV